MNEEIKEIDIKKDLYLCSPLLNKECTKENCYINNGSCCHTVNKEYSQEHLLNYITNLQKENEKLKEEIEHYKIMFSNYFYEELYPDENEEDCIYKSRNEKAVEYIKSKKAIINTDYIRIFDLFEIEEQGYTKDLLNILQGGDE